MQDIVTERSYLNVGPSHPAMRSSLRVLLELSGERVTKAVPEIGYLHRGFEKEVESHGWASAIPYAERLNYASPMMNGIGYCMAVEKLMGSEIPERAAWMRMLCCEVSRICDHLICVATNLADIGALTNGGYLLRPRERFLEWVEALSGSRLTANFSRIGGVSRDLPGGSAAALGRAIGELRAALRDARGLARRNRIFLDRTRGVGSIGREEAVEWGFTGPCLRAAGCDYDVRKDHPYLFYHELDWDVPVGECGDTYDRIFVRMEEIEQSAWMIEQILERMSSGPIMADDLRNALPPKEEVYGTIEGMIRHFKVATRGIRPPVGEVYSYSEAANGELGFYAVSDGSEMPYRIKVRPPSFAVCQAFPRLIEGETIADVMAILGSLNIVAGELDR
jgi:NADH dehydrogenase I D subunit